MATVKSASLKSIARVKGKVSANIYRGRFNIAEHLCYLDRNVGGSSFSQCVSLTLRRPSLGALLPVTGIQQRQGSPAPIFE
jgi:hypothetical protein